MNRILIILAFTTFLLSQQAEITNVQVAQRTDGSKLVDITYDLTEDEIVKVRDWQTFQYHLRERGKKENNRDYYCVVLNKTTNEVHLTSLKTLYALTPNGNNLLFQINWGRNTNPVLRTHSEAYDFLVGTYKKSVEKKVSVHEGYETL